MDDRGRDTYKHMSSAQNSIENALTFVQVENSFTNEVYISPGS